MSKLRVLIVEDDVLSAMELEQALAEAFAVEFTTRNSVRGTEAVLDQNFDFAFLDIEVTDGRTFDIARKLDRRFIPFAFVSALQRHMVPVELQSAPFIPKPYTRTEITELLRNSLANDNGD